jgi:NitT/TauT family transport system permease protein/taurine transport system permease protein
MTDSVTSPVESVQPTTTARQPNQRRKPPRWRRRALYAIVIAAGVGVWELLTLFSVFPAVALPSPAAVYDAYVSTTTVGYLGETLQQDILYSVIRVVVGFVGAVIVGVLIGLLMARIRLVHQIIDPYLQFGRPVPPLAYIPLFVVWFGIGELPKILLILVGTLPIIIINTVAGVRNIPGERFEVAQCLGATPRQVFFRVVLPSALPEVFTGMKVGIGIAWTCLVAAELIASNVGLGWVVEQAANQLQIAIVIGGIIVIGILGYGMELCIRAAEAILVPWRGHV